MKGVAWSGPLVTAAAIAPAVAASDTPGGLADPLGLLTPTGSPSTAPTATPTPTPTGVAPATCSSGRYQLRWSGIYGAIAVSQFSTDVLNGATPRNTSGTKINRSSVTVTPTDLTCLNPDFTVTATTTRYGVAFDSYTCVPGWSYATLEPGSQCNGLATTNSKWKDGANLIQQIGAPGGGPIAGTTEGIALGWNSWQGATNRSSWTFTFNQPVYNLTFNLYMFDWANTTLTLQTTNTGNREVGYISPAPTSFSQGSQVGGSGTAGDPWRAVYPTGDPGGYSDPTGGITDIHYAGATTSFTITAWSEDTLHRTSENIFLSNLYFDCPMCPPA